MDKLKLDVEEDDGEESALGDLLGLPDEQPLDFNDRPRSFEEHTFEADFEHELEEALGDDEIVEEIELLSEDDLELLEMDLEYQQWLNEGGHNDEQ